jgi:hypothetical protein
MAGRRAPSLASTHKAAASFGALAAPKKPPLAMTYETSKQNDDDRQIDVNIGTCKRLLIDAYKRYNEAMKDGAHHVASYWDGYIRGIQHVLEADGQ